MLQGSRVLQEMTKEQIAWNVREMFQSLIIIQFHIHRLSVFWFLFLSQQWVS